MTTTEMSNEFDVLYNNITSNQAPGLDEYEKAVFLTLALDEILKAYFDPKLNKPLEGFDGSQRRQIDFSTLMTTIKAIPSEAEYHLHPDSLNFLVPGNILFYINEQLTVNRGSNKVNLTVVPISYVEFNRVMSKPYKRPLKWQAWRMITTGNGNDTQMWDYGALATYINSLMAKYGMSEMTNGDIQRLLQSGLYFYHNEDTGKYWVRSSDAYSADVLTVKVLPSIQLDYGIQWKPVSALNNNIIPIELTAEQVTYMSTLKKYSNINVEIVPSFKTDVVDSYIVRYVRRPNPIVLVQLEDDNLSLNGGIKNETACELDPILHHEIVLRAVELAKAAYVGDLNSMLAVGINSTTPMGMVSSGRGSRED